MPDAVELSPGSLDELRAALPASSGGRLLGDLVRRGLVQDVTDPVALAAMLSEGPVGLYCGFDPTADSLHAGNLLGLLALRRFQLAGHRPIALAGGATGMIGDPSGRSEERNLLDDETLNRNLAAIKAQITRLLDFEDPAVGAVLVDNRDWTGDLRLIDFLRDVGKHVTVNQMAAKESIRARMRSEAGISYTEFSYMLLQANDYVWLWDRHDCRLQIGGSDQWGNITAGIDLVRRRFGGRAHGLTWPLMTRADGAKFGKTAEGAIWLDPSRTSPYQFFQYWIRTDDRDVERLLLQLTLLAVDEVEGIVAEHREAPERRVAQRRLAAEVTEIVHGPTARHAAEEATALLFGGRQEGPPTEEALATLVGEVPTAQLERSRLADGLPVADLLADTGVAGSRSEARRLLDQGGITINGRRCAAGEAVGVEALWHGRYLLVQRGKKHVHVVVAG